MTAGPRDLRRGHLLERQPLLSGHTAITLRPRALGPGGQRVRDPAHDERAAELARYKLGRLSTDDADGYHRVMCPAAMGKLRCPRRAGSLALSYDRPEITAPPDPAPRCCTQATLSVPPEVNAKTAEARLSLECASPLLCPSHCSRANVFDHEGSGLHRRDQRLVPGDGSRRHQRATRVCRRGAQRACSTPSRSAAAATCVVRPSVSSPSAGDADEERSTTSLPRHQVESSGSPTTEYRSGRRPVVAPVRHRPI